MTESWWGILSRGKERYLYFDRPLGNSEFSLCQAGSSWTKTRLPQCQAGNSIRWCVENLSPLLPSRQKCQMTPWDRRSQAYDTSYDQLERLIGGILYMTHIDRRFLTNDASAKRDKNSSFILDWLIFICGSFHYLGYVVAFRFWLLPSRLQSESMGREPVSWITKDKAGISGWSILIYDSLLSAIPKGWRVIFLAIDKGERVYWWNLIYDSLLSAIP